MWLGEMIGRWSDWLSHIGHFSSSAEIMLLFTSFNPLRANYCHTWHMENHPFLWRRIRRVRRIQVCMAREGLSLLCWSQLITVNAFNRVTNSSFMSRCWQNLSRYKQVLCFLLRKCEENEPSCEKTSLTPENPILRVSTEIFSFGHFRTAWKEKQNVFWNGQDMAVWNRAIHGLSIGLLDVDPASLKNFAASVRSVLSRGGSNFGDTSSVDEDNEIKEQKLEKN